MAGSGSVASGIQMSGLNTITIQPGDTLGLWQYTVAENGAAGGIWVGFTDGNFSTLGRRGMLYDSDGQPSNMDGTTGQWHRRTIDLTQFQGETVNNFILLDERNGAVGQFDLYFADVSLRRADGTLVPMWTGSPSPSTLTTTVFGPGQATAQVNAGTPANTSNSLLGTHFFLADPLGSTQMEVSGGGWPLWQGEFTPFGQEIVAGQSINPGSSDGTGMRYKFTGKERDAESGLDYFGARYYGSVSGRWLSPDLVNVTEDRMMNPSSTLNKYAYGANNPLKYTDPDGQDVTVFYEAANIFSSQPSPGHTMLLAYNQQTGDSAVRSFGPDHSAPGFSYTETVTGEAGTDSFGFDSIKSADDLRASLASVTIQTTPEEAQQVINEIRAHPDGNYTLLSHNCTTTCSRLLRSIGKTRSHALQPGGFFGDLVQQYGPHRGGKVGLDFRPGSMWGQPRSGYNPFQLFFNDIPKNNPEGTPKRNTAPPCLKSRGTGDCS